MFGTSNEEAKGRFPQEVLPESLVESSKQHDQKTLKFGQMSAKEEGVHLADRHYTLLTHKFPIFDGKGIVKGVGSIATDITERKQIEKRLSELQRELAHLSRVSTVGEMAAGLAHELNQPLTAINNYAKGTLHRLRSGKGNPEELLSVMERVADQAMRAGHIIRKIRRYVDKVEPVTSRVDVNEAIREAVTLLAGETHIADVTMNLILPVSVPEAMADSIYVQQVVLNLARNAIEAMVDHGSEVRQLTICTATTRENTIEVTVTDTGPGVPLEATERMFKPFFTTKAGGLGMGLAISRSLVEILDGRLWITSDAETGTTFHFTLPIATGDTDGNA